MIGVDTHVVTLEVEGKLAVFDVFQFILMQVRPPPQPGIDYMGEPFTSSHLQPSIKCPLNGHTLAGMGPVGGDSSDEGVKLVFLLLQLFHQALDGPLGKRLALATLSVTHQAVHNAQAGVVAGGCVGDGHLDLSLTALSENIMLLTVPLNQEAGAVTISTAVQLQMGQMWDHKALSIRRRGDKIWS